MITTHRTLQGDARALPLPDASVHLVVTSPPYPMIAMWDEAFGGMAPESRAALAAGRGPEAFEAQHAALDAAWAECARVLRPGGFLCVNVGDATRSLAGHFACYPNAGRVGAALMRLGLTPLPDILWRKPNNSPNKFMGSGMLPGGAYVTYEHEYVLVFRKGARRVFRGEERERRAASAYFWEERNLWFSDLWSDLRGRDQRLGTARERSGAFPFELPFRLLHMYSIQGDVVLDPFAGTGTTAAAALAGGRSSVMVEREASLVEGAEETLRRGLRLGQDRARERLRAHRSFMEERAGGYASLIYDFRVVTRQEIRLRVSVPKALDGERAEHDPGPSAR